jgi:hypothetical protein
MGEFFHGWRRKAGCVSLAIACLLTIGWVRSHVKDDVIVVHVGKTWLLNFQSNQCGLGVRAAAYGTTTSTIKATWNSQPILNSASNDPMKDVHVPFRFDFLGFHFGCDGLNLLQPRYFSICVVSYFTAITPLTLLSTYLLLVKPRIAKPRVLVENVTLG